MKEKKDLITRLQMLDRRIIYTIALICVVVPLVYPLGLPIPISQDTKNMYDILESLQPGDKALVLNGFIPAFKPRHFPGTYAILQHLSIKEGVKFVMAEWKTVGVVDYTNEVMNSIANPYNKKYGEDWVELGYLPGNEAAFAQWSKDFRGSYQNDVYGTPIDQIPVMNGVNTIGDFKVVIHMGNANDLEWGARQIGINWDVPYVGYVMTGGAQFLKAYLGAGVEAGFLVPQGGAEYQLLVGPPYTTIIAEMDSNGVANMYYIVLMIIPSILVIARYLTKEEKK